MKRFHFQLEALLQVRRLEEERKLGEFRGVQRRLVEVTTQLREITEEQAKLSESLASLEAAGQLPISEILQHRRYQVHLHRREYGLHGELRTHQEHVAAARQLLQVASRERQVVERLRERRYQEYLELVRREESLEMDEIGRNRHAFVAPKAGGE